MAADRATVSISASLLPDEIKTSISGTTVYDLDDFGDNNKWVYTLTNVGATSEDLITTGTTYLGQGTSDEGATGTTQGTDDVLFIFVKHSGTTNGSTTTTANLHISTAAGTASGTATGDVVLKPNECWFARLSTDTKIEDINGDSSSGVVQAQVFAICDDGGV